MNTNWRRCIAHIVLAGFLSSGIWVFGALITTNRVILAVVAPVAALPFLYRVIVDLTTAYNILPETFTVSTRELLLWSLLGGTVGGGAIYLLTLWVELPGGIMSRLVYISLIVEWLVMHSIYIYRIRSFGDPPSDRNPEAS